LSLCKYDNKITMGLARFDKRRVWRAFEFFALFFLLPTLFYLGHFQVAALPVLWLVMIYCLVVLWRSRGLDGSLLWNAVPLIPRAPGILLLFALCAALLTGLVYWLAPDRLFGLIRMHPYSWALVMVSYPILSVYPQGVIYRAFLFERYRPLFDSSWPIVLMSTLAFAYVHIVFRNSIAPALTLAGGFLFAMRYRQSGSLLVSCVEHALYGCFLFTVGLGRFFLYAATWKP